ncbi:MAG: hypothetical protein ACO1OT_08910 [Heyndrickxia sp.]
MGKLNVVYINKSQFKLKDVPLKYLFILEYAKEYASSYTEFVEFYHLGVDVYRSFCRGKRNLGCHQAARSFVKMVLRGERNERSGEDREREKFENEIFRGGIDNSMKELFIKKPDKWGLRGDINLWEALERHSADLPMPTSREELSEKLQQMFQALTGQPLQPGEDLYVHLFDTGGLSRGMVKCDFWINKAFPLLLQRYDQLQAAQNL